jgi:Leucine-rich repeat (LRR) protein
MTTPTRSAAKDNVFQFLEEQNVYADSAKFTYYKNTVKTPQHRAVAWLAREDHANLKVPDPTADDASTAIYNYLVRYIMAVIFYALGGPDHWSNKLGFLTKFSVCTWQGHVVSGSTLLEGGIYCPGDSGPPTELRLGFVQAKGQLPSEIGLLTSLTHLDFGSSSLREAMPPEICKIWKLEKLDLSDNELSGELPPCLGSMSALKWIYVNGNLFTGTIPNQTMALTQLERLVLEDNELSGDPTHIFNKMSALQLLYVGKNNFTGLIDSNFMKGHKSLIVLDVSRNQFRFENTTGFPAELLRLSSLTHLDLSMNPLQGSFPKVLLNKASTNHKLNFLSLHDTKMKGVLPQLDQFVAMQHLDMSRNSFHGTIPSSYGNLTHLELFYLSENHRLTAGTIPSSFHQLTKLRDLSIRETNRNGSIPSFIGANLTGLVLLDLGINNFTSALPSDFKNLQNLEYLLLNGNEQLSGGLRSLKYLLKKLKILLLDGTKLTENFDCPPVTNTSSDLVVYVDCANVSVPPCTCCKCCKVGAGRGCSETLLANVDASWFNTFNRTSYSFFEKGEH